jgi:hypothetical protein
MLTFDRRTVVSLILVTSFVIIILVWLFYPPALNDTQNQIVSMLIGALIGQVTNVIAFDFGSSSGSKAKDDALIQASQTGGGGANIQDSTVTVEPDAGRNP